MIAGTQSFQSIPAKSQSNYQKWAYFQFIAWCSNAYWGFNSHQNQIKQTEVMQSLKNENAKLAAMIEQCLEQIERQKEINSQHETQIETLLTFNQRLLSIIETEIHDKKKETWSLQPIQERSERSSDLFGKCTMESLIRSKKLVAKSEWGRPTQSLIDKKVLNSNKCKFFDHVSDVESIKDENSSETAINEQQASGELKKSGSMGMEFRRQVQKGLEELREFKDKTNIFYSKKLAQIRSLSAKLSKYHPLYQISQISAKISMSNETLNLINNRIAKTI